MARGPIVTQEVENYISQVYSLHKKWKAPEVQREVVYNLNHNLELRKRLRLPAHLPKNWPGLNKVQKVLTVIRDYEKKHPSDPQDEPWSIASLEYYPMESHVFPVVRDLWRYRIIEGFRRLTIREAKWAARLSGLIYSEPKIIRRTLADVERISGVGDPKINSRTREMSWLSFMAFTYAYFEINYRKIGEGVSKFNSESIDLLMYPTPVFAEEKEGINVKDIPDDSKSPLSDAVDRYADIIHGAYVHFVLDVENERSHSKEIQE